MKTGVQRGGGGEQWSVVRVLRRVPALSFSFRTLKNRNMTPPLFPVFVSSVWSLSDALWSQSTAEPHVRLSLESGAWVWARWPSHVRLRWNSPLLFICFYFLLPPPCHIPPYLSLLWWLLFLLTTLPPWIVSFSLRHNSLFLSAPFPPPSYPSSLDGW